MNTTLLIAAVLAVFTVFASAVAWVEFRTRDLVPPGARQPD